MFFPGLNLAQGRYDLFRLVEGPAAQTGARVEAAPGAGRSLLVYLDNAAYTGGLPYGDIVGQWLDDAGLPVDAPFVIAEATEAERFYRPYVSYNSYNHSFLVSAPAYSSTVGSYATFAVVNLSGTVSATQRIGPGVWTADLERMIVSEVDPATGDWLLFWDGGFYNGVSWGSCGLALLVDANGNPVGDPFQVTPWGTTGALQIVPAMAFDPDHHRWLLAWSTHPHSAPRRVYGRLVNWSGGQVVTSTTISIATTYHDAFAPAVQYNPVTDEFLVAFTVNGIVSGTSYSWTPFYQRVTVSGTLPGGVEAPFHLPKFGTHNWTDANSLEVVTSNEPLRAVTSEYLLSYVSVRDGGGFFTGPYDVRQFKLDSLGVPLDDGLVSDFTPYATDTEFDVSIGVSNTVLAVWGDLRAERGAPDVYGRRYGVGDDLLSPRATKYYYFGGQRVAMRTPEGPRPELAEGVYYLHGDHLGSTSLVTNDSGSEVARQLYYPYGEPRWVSGTVPTDFGYTGQRLDGTGLMFYKARYYHPALGRFASADTIVPDFANPQSLNRFSYTLGNPLNLVDPTGYQAEGETYAPLTPELWELVTYYAELYGIPIELLAGTIAVEIEHDTDPWDPYIDWFLLMAINCAEGCLTEAGNFSSLLLAAWDYGTGRGPGPGVSNFHTETARDVEEYFRHYYANFPDLLLPFNDNGDDYPEVSYRRTEYLIYDQGNVHYTAAYLRMLADYRKGNGGLPNTQPHLQDLTVDDMTVINGAFRSGMIGGWGRIEEYQTATRSGDLGLLILPYLGRYRRLAFPNTLWLPLISQ